MKNSLVIRNAQESDVPVILELIQGLAEYEKLPHEVVATEERLRQTLFGRKPSAEVLIADYDEAPAGFALFFHNYSTFLAQPGIYLEDLYINPSLRRKGIGKALLKKLAQIAVERDCGRLEWSVLDWNESARTFYRTLGAVPMEEWTVFRLTGEPLRTLGKE
jgi:GNAT superfamily N-acetyltransferase